MTVSVQSQRLELPPLDERTRLEFTASDGFLTHRLFRYPAKFHPPVARALIDRYSEPSEVVYDPFCGSGTLLVEAAVSNRQGVGSDIDPLAVLISKAKVIRYDIAEVERGVRALAETVAAAQAVELARNGSFEDDVDVVTYERLLGTSVPPAIPNLFHWFRRRVIIQLLEIQELIGATQVTDQTRQLLQLCFGSIIRNSSNADPVPVSGLEVTAHMLRKEEAGRLIDPYRLFLKAIAKAETAARAFVEAASEQRQFVFQHDATQPHTDPLSVDAVITSPPYMSAVDYYRRHQLEMFWLGLTATAADRLQLLPQYIGRSSVPQRLVANWVEMASPVVVDWDRRLQDQPKRLPAFRHYVRTMQSALQVAAAAVKPGGKLVLVVGDSKVGGVHFPTAQLLTELARPNFEHAETLWYPIANRYMSYSRHNSADIGHETVLAFERRSL